MNRMFHALAIGGVLIVAMGCRKKPDQVDTMSKVEVIQTDPSATSDSQDAEDRAMAELSHNFKRVHFALDKSQLNAASKDALTDNAGILQKFNKITIEIQGHADSRGTTDYNLALGQRRARSVKRYLSMLGVQESRLTIVSYGEEKPLVHRETEQAWSQNRRAEFRIISGNGKVSGTVN